MPFSLLFSVESRLHTLFARCSTFSARIVHADYLRPLRGLLAAITRILRGRYADHLRLSVRLFAAVRVEQPWNSAEKLSFRCHVPYLVERAMVTHTFHRYQRKSTGLSKWRLFSNHSFVVVPKSEKIWASSNLLRGTLWSNVVMHLCYLTSLFIYRLPEEARHAAMLCYADDITLVTISAGEREASAALLNSDL